MTTAKLALRRLMLGLPVAAILPSTLNGQTPFEVASVRSNKAPISRDAPASVRIEGNRLTLRNVPLRQMLQMAYKVDADDVDGPGWISTERFDIVAKAAVPFSASNAWQPMLKQLLVERFHLSGHLEARSAKGFDLVRERSDGSLGPALRRAAEDCYGKRAGRVAADGGADPCGLSSVFDAELTGHVKLHGVPLAVLLRIIALDQSGQPPLDATGLAGNFDIELVWTPQPYFTTGHAPDRRPEPDRSAPALNTALQEQLGLKLEPRRVSKEALIVEHIERPTEN